MQRVASYEHKNDYYYIILRQAPERGQQAFVLCCGINMPRFDPICWGKAGTCSNPAFRGLQQLRADVSSYVHTLGKRSRNAAAVWIVLIPAFLTSYHPTLVPLP